MSRLHRATIINRSGLTITAHPSVSPLQKGNYRRVNAAIAGDAPKDFLRIYEYGDGRKSNSSKWPGYIAKVGQKYYPNESITEHLLTRIGQAMGMDMADSRLMFVHGQLRFLSRYFLKKNESLEHGAEIFANCLADKEFVENVEQANLSRDVFTFQFVEESLMDQFPDEAKELIEEFVKLLGFDALIGNNDRHFYNWEVITDVRGQNRPRFSPVYDSARALYWNTKDVDLEEVNNSADRNRMAAFEQKYIEKCFPKTGWDGLASPNHFALIERIANKRASMKCILEKFCDIDLKMILESLFEEEFCNLLTETRQKFVINCLENRQKRFREVIN